MLCISIRVKAKRGRSCRKSMDGKGMKTIGTVKHCLGLWDQRARRDYERLLATNAYGVRRLVLACTHSKWTRCPWYDVIRVWVSSMWRELGPCSIPGSSRIHCMAIWSTRGWPWFESVRCLVSLNVNSKKEWCTEILDTKAQRIYLANDWMIKWTHPANQPSTHCCQRPGCTLHLRMDGGLISMLGKHDIAFQNAPLLICILCLAFRQSLCWGSTWSLHSSCLDVVSDLLSLDCLLCLFVRSTEGMKRLQTFKLPPSQKIFRALLEWLFVLTNSCSQTHSCAAVQAMATPWKRTFGIEICCIMHGHNKWKLVACQSRENVRFSPS